MLPSDPLTLPESGGEPEPFDEELESLVDALFNVERRYEVTGRPSSYRVRAADILAEQRRLASIGRPSWKRRLRRAIGYGVSR